MKVSFLSEIRQFVLALFFYTKKRFLRAFFRFEHSKDWLVDKLYKQRGRWARPFEHVSFVGLIILGTLLAPVIAESYQTSRASAGTVPIVLGVTTEATTEISQKPRGEIAVYIVQPGDTVSTIAEKFGVSENTIRWANNLQKDKLKASQELKILPINGIAHKVQRGETVWSIAKKYSVGAQGIVDFPFNTFVNDEKFTVAVGQTLIVPDGVMPKEQPVYLAQTTPDAGTVTAIGQFAWPVQGRITQGYIWYHKAIDIANKSAPPILAADSGKVIGAGSPWGWGYGNHVIIDHNNGYQTLYAHLSKIYVREGQSVKRGDSLGQMGATGRATGIHLHFEIIKNGVKVNPLEYLQ